MQIVNVSVNWGEFDFCIKSSEIKEKIKLVIVLSKLIGTVGVAILTATY